MYKSVLRPIFFTLDSEAAHHAALRCARVAGGVAPVRAALSSALRYDDPVLESECMGLRFRNPIGLAAGFDKNAEALPLLTALGFGFLELGSITGQAQAGNPKPRIFRFPADNALINRMGFPSDGADVVAERLARIPREKSGIVLGVNLGKTKVVPIDDALSDYLYTFEKVLPYADYVALNVSSPNTPELRKLQERPRLEALFRGVQERNVRRIPLLVKIAPDLDFPQIDDVLECCLACGVSGLIATNTTFSRQGLSVSTEESGGMSGAPLRDRARAIVSYISQRTQKRVPIIGVGGVFSGKDAFELISAGASLVQIYTALIYEGPGVVKNINRDLARLLRERGVSRISELVGNSHN